MRTSIPQPKLFKGKDYIGDLKKELKKLYKEDRDLPIVPKFPKRDFLQSSPALNEAPPVCKKVCKKELEEKSSQTTLHMVERIQKSTTQHATSENRSVIPPDEKPMVSKDMHPSNSENHLERFGLKQTENENAIAKETKNLDGIDRKDRKLGDIHVASTFSKDRFTNFLKQPNIQQILRQPISTLRAPRKQPYQNRSQLSPFVNFHNQESYSSFGKPDSYIGKSDTRINRPIVSDTTSDFLDFIDSIPIRTLEHQLFGAESRQTVPASLQHLFRNDRQNSLERVYYKNLVRGGSSNTLEVSQSSDAMMSLEMQKPTLESPSPPKLYRMNMY